MDHCSFPLASLLRLVWSSCWRVFKSPTDACHHATQRHCGGGHLPRGADGYTPAWALHLHWILALVATDTLPGNPLVGGNAAHLSQAMEQRLVRAQTVDRNPFKRQPATSSSVLSKKAPVVKGSRKWFARVIGRVFKASESFEGSLLLNDSVASW